MEAQAEHLMTKPILEPSKDHRGTLETLNERSAEIFREVVETYLKTGEPVGSLALAHRRHNTLSPASIRNVMAQLESAGLLRAPHTSAGRVPTQLGLRLFVDGFLEVGGLSEEERKSFTGQLDSGSGRLEDLLTQATDMLSGLSHCTGLVLAPKLDSPLKHLEFVPISTGRALVVMVNEDGVVENRVIETPAGMAHSNLVEAGNFLTARLSGKRLDEVREQVLTEVTSDKAAIDELTARVVQAGLAEKGGDAEKTLIVRGHSKLLADVRGAEDLEKIGKLLDDLEQKKDLIRLLELAGDAEGVKIFIGSESQLFSLSGSSLIVAPYGHGNEKILGAIGVIGPTRLNYARIVPMVDYTARMIGRLLDPSQPVRLRS